MHLLVTEKGMAKKRGRPKTSTGEGPPVRMEADLYGMAKYIASARGESVAKVVSDLSRPAIEREFQKLGQKLAKELKPKAEDQ